MLANSSWSGWGSLALRHALFLARAKVVQVPSVQYICLSCRQGFSPASSGGCSGMLVVISILLWSLASCQQQQATPPANMTCSYRYLMSISDTTAIFPCQGSCLQSSPSLLQQAGGGCMSLWNILELHDDELGAGDCLELLFTPGSYLLPSMDRVRVHDYSLIMSAPEGRVTFSCAEESGCEGDGSVGGASGRVGTAIAMVAFDGTETDDMFVTIEGIVFRSCSRRLQFDEVSYVSIRNCSFIDFSESALDLMNVHQVEIQESLFQDCVSSNGSEEFRGNSGAVSFAYYRGENTSGPITPNITISGCTFINNSAILPGTNTDEINQALNLNFYYGRGGGLCIIPQGYHANVQALVTNTTFQQNRADAFGGAVYLLINGAETSHNIHFEECVFLQNVGGPTSFGGGIQVAVLLRNLESEPTTVFVRNSRFEENYANFGGGLSFIQVYSQGRGNRVVVEGTDFIGNSAGSVGAAIMLQTFTYTQSRLAPHFYSFTDCAFSNNMAPGGIFGAGSVSMNFSGNIRFLNNTGPALRIVGGYLLSKGNLSFVGNKVISNEGGALFIQEFGQVKLIPGTELQFINNTGRIGSAIVVDVQRSPSAYTELVHNPQCFLIYENSTEQPTEWKDVSIKFSGNQASIGPVVFISHILHCSWYSVEFENETNQININFSRKSFSNWTAFHYDSTNRGSAHNDEDPSDPRFYFQTQPSMINISDITRKISPGEPIPLSLEGVDQFGSPTYLIARFSDSRSDINLGAFSQAEGSNAVPASNNNNMQEREQEAVQFDPTLLPVQPNVGEASIRYGFIDEKHLDHGNETVSVVIDTPFNVLQSDPLTFDLVLTNCQPGYQLRKSTNNLFTCQCTDSDFFVLNCEEDVIVLRDGFWAGMEEGVSPHLDLTVCPTPYCRCRRRSNQQLCESLYYQDNTEADQQCHPLRNGTLCGRCINETTVGVLRSHCRHCEEDKYYTLGFLIVGDILIISFIMFAVLKLNMHFPHSMKGFLFYIQTVYYTTEHFPIAFWDVRKYMLYVSSALGLYFPYDFCLYPGMTSLVAFGLKFIPSAVAVIIAVIVTIGTYAVRVRNGRKRVWRALWFLVLLLYAPLFHNCVALLKCPLIPNVAGMDEERHWFYDGEVVCFKDPGHIFLSIIAIIVLMILVLLSPTIFIFTLVANSKKVKGKSLTVDRIMAALTEGYRDSLEATWFTSWEIFRRLLLISIVVSLPGRSVAAAFVTIGAFAVHLFFKPYRKVFQNVIEALVLLNYSLLIVLRSSQTFLDNATSSGYTGTAFPDFTNDSLPDYDSVIWLFLPFFYGPLVAAFLLGLGAPLYWVIKSLVRKRQKKDVDLGVDASYVFREDDTVTRTEVAI